MKGDLPCLDVSVQCVGQLQQTAVGNNPTLRNIEASIEEVNTKINEARAANKRVVDIGVFKPLVQAYLKLETSSTAPTPDNPTPQVRTRGFIERIAGIFTNPFGAVNEILSLIGIPLFDKITGTNVDAQKNAIAISDLQVKVAELQKGKAEIAEKLRETIQIQVIDFDTAAREFQISQEIAKREISRLKIIEVSYRFGEGNSEGYLSQLSAMDSKKAATLRSWAQMRSRLERIKLLVLARED